MRFSQQDIGAGVDNTYNRELAEPVLTDRPDDGAEGLAPNMLRCGSLG